ncbi:MAG: NAD-dependent epimerase/dehydratase family protein [Limisphaerales bacterium]
MNSAPNPDHGHGHGHSHVHADLAALLARSGRPTRWLVTGVAGFIGSHLLEALLRNEQQVVGLDNLSTGHRRNLDAVRNLVSAEQWGRFDFREGDITRPDDVRAAVQGCDRILHQAALGSVPLSLEQPVTTHASNITGFLHVLEAARAAGVGRVVYASSSAVYGDCTERPAREDRIGAPLSPYALSKWVDEAYAALFERCYGLRSVGLRYFNVCGPRQDPNGAYAAVIPRWIDALTYGRPVEIHGDGATTRDFCPVENVVEANLRAALVELPEQSPRVFNVGLGAETSLNDLHAILQRRIAASPGTRPAAAGAPRHGPERPGDVRFSRADISMARRWLGFEGRHSLEDSLAATVHWFLSK